MMTSLSDEELSELAEALEDACQNAIVSSRNMDCYCPLGALFCRGWNNRPGAAAVSLPREVAISFGRGFDGLDFDIDGYCDIRAYELGKLFREKYP